MNHAYLRLMRFDKPVGIVLLWVPTAWALWLANGGAPSWLLLLYFFLGTVVMRAAGCVINDMADRDFDKHVKRTKMRPLAAGEVSLKKALLLFMALFATALLIALQLPRACFYLACVAAVLTVVYPFCKRFFQAPQLVLGLAFSMGIPMAYAASEQAMDASMVLLFLLNFAWIVAYDTLYAMVDREDDLTIGVKSTAILFAHFDRGMVFLLHVLCHGLWLVIAIKLQLSYFFYACWLLAGGVLVHQQLLIKDRKPAACFRAFRLNSWYGLLMWLGLMV